MFKLIIFLFFTIFQVNAQKSIDEKQFFKNMDKSYYSLAATNLSNFTALVTNLSVEKFGLDNWKNDEIFPLQLIWSSPNRIFISEQGVPSLSDSLKNTYLVKISSLKLQIQDILLNLRKFYFNGIYQSISENYILKHAEEVVSIEFIESSKIFAGPALASKPSFCKCPRPVRSRISTGCRRASVSISAPSSPGTHCISPKREKMISTANRASTCFTASRPV